GMSTRPVFSNPAGDTRQSMPRPCLKPSAWLSPLPSGPLAGTGWAVDGARHRSPRAEHETRDQHSAGGAVVGRRDAEPERSLKEGAAENDADARALSISLTRSGVMVHKISAAIEWTFRAGSSQLSEQ